MVPVRVQPCTNIMRLCGIDTTAEFRIKEIQGCVPMLCPSIKDNFENVIVFFEILSCLSKLFRGQIAFVYESKMSLVIAESLLFAFYLFTLFWQRNSKVNPTQLAVSRLPLRSCDVQM